MTDHSYESLFRGDDDTTGRENSARWRRSLAGEDPTVSTCEGDSVCDWRGVDTGFIDGVIDSAALRDAEGDNVGTTLEAVIVLVLLRVCPVALCVGPALCDVDTESDVVSSSLPYSKLQSVGVSRKLVSQSKGGSPTEQIKYFLACITKGGPQVNTISLAYCIGH